MSITDVVPDVADIPDLDLAELPAPELSRAEMLSLVDKAKRRQLVASLTEAAAVALRYRWEFWARPDQMPPSGPWTIWNVIAARGTGKTRTGAEWARKKGPTAREGVLLGANPRDVRDLMIEGRSLALGTLVPTPSGWTTMGELTAGDVILGGDGLPCRVTGVSEVHHDRPCYRVGFKGGPYVIADGDHLWLTENFNARVNATYNPRKFYGSVVTTDQMRASLWYTSPSNRQANHAIRVTPTVDYGPQAAALPLDPYLLGCWLGDGNTRDACITTADPEMLEHFRAAGYRVRQRKDAGDHGAARSYGISGGMLRDLRAAGVAGNKHVPPAYLRASPDVRLAVVQGLMDTDGSVSERGQCDFAITLPHLADAMVELLCSLGVKASAVIVRPPNLAHRRLLPSYRVRFTTTLPVFRLRRKLARLPGHTRDHKHWFVKSIDAVESVPVRCITVDSPDRTFLVTRHHIKTHNSGLLQVSPNGERPRYEPSKLKLTWPNGAVAHIRSAEDPESVRGLSAEWAWCDEPAKWRFLLETWQMLRFAMREGRNPQTVLTTTPKPLDLIIALADGRFPGSNRRSPGIVNAPVVSTYRNKAHLARDFIEEIATSFEGTRLGAQELHGLIVTDIEGALWSWKLIEAARWAGQWHDQGGGLMAPILPEMKRKVCAVDPPGSSKGAECGIVVVGIDRGRPPIAYVLDDRSRRGSPYEWGRAALRAYFDNDCNMMIGETNFGGEMVEHTIKTIPAERDERTGKEYPSGDYIRFDTVHAGKGKKLRAEPTVALYDQTARGFRRIYHVGTFGDLESQMCFPAGTLVSTADGEVPIERIVAGTQVWTRAGLRTVSWAGPTSVQSEMADIGLPGGGNLSCSMCHPIWTETRGFVPAWNVSPSDLLLVSETAMRGLGAWPGADSGTPKCPVGITATMSRDSFTGESGRHTSARSARATSSITSTMIQPTTGSGISRGSPLPSIAGSMVSCGDSRGSMPTSEAPAPSRDGRRLLRTPSPALVVAQSFTRSACGPRSAPSLAVVPTTGSTARSCVPELLYDLTVEGEPEFFANGVLVHNCGWVPDQGDSPDRVDACVWGINYLIGGRTYKGSGQGNLSALTGTSIS